MALNSKFHFGVYADYTTALDLTSVSAPLSIDQTVQLTNGTGANQADKIWHDTRTIAASGTDDLDLAGTLVDAFGATVTFARIKGIFVRAAAANTNNIQLGGAAANGFITWVGAATDKVVIRPGGDFLLTAPDATAYAVTAGTADLLRVTNAAGGTSVTYDIAIIGSSA